MHYRIHLYSPLSFNNSFLVASVTVSNKRTTESLIPLNIIESTQSSKRGGDESRTWVGGLRVRGYVFMFMSMWV